MWNLMDSEFRYACAYFMSIIVIGEAQACIITSLQRAYYFQRL